MAKPFKDLVIVELTTYVAASTAGRLFDRVGKVGVSAAN